MIGGVVFSVQQELFFLPATIAGKVLPMPSVARVPGAPPDLVGVALVEGEVIPVVAVGPTTEPRGRDHRPMLVCTFLGERVAFVGIEVVATGSFTPTDDGVDHEGARARSFDVGAVVARLGEGRWAV
ncbi:MAG: chemotaxis protein CheW [Labilithrix sp.]|nr:chemotaxis protein CheW [Labilithrix sp.]